MKFKKVFYLLILNVKCFLDLQLQHLDEGKQMASLRAIWLAVISDRS